MRRVALLVATVLATAGLQGPAGGQSAAQGSWRHLGSLPSQPAAQPAAQGPWRHLVGLLHTHTGYSDGRPGTTPATAYARARGLGLAFAAVTEHSEALDVPVTLSEQCLPTEGGGLAECALADAPLEALGKWDAQRRQAAEASVPDTFSALRGFEWTSDVYGHINVYFSRNYSTRLRDAGDTALEAFYAWLLTPPAAGGGADGLATFNHPGDKCLAAADPRCNWHDFLYLPALDDRIVGIEVFNRFRAYEAYVVRALDRGWHLGLVGAEDIHGADWGDPGYPKTVFLAPRNTPADLKAALAARRVYATRDASVRIELSAGGLPMGSRIPVGQAQLEVRVEGGDVSRLDLLTNGGTVAASVQGRELSASLSAPPGAERWYLVRVMSGERPVAYSSPVWVGSPPRPETFTPRWVAGDLHVHTTWSHDVYGGPTDDNTGPEEAYTAGWTPGEQLAIAEERGLDFVAITDHNDTRSVYDPSLNSDRLTIIPGYENSLAGHAQMLGAISCYAPGGRAAQTSGCNGLLDTGDPAQVRALAAALRADGGVFQVNHPSDGAWRAAFGDGGAPDPIVPDTVEVWNIGPWHYQPPLPAANDNDQALRFWETYLRAGYRVAATGGSDSHWRSTSWAQGVGQPTTWVYVTRPGVDGILEGLRSGRTSLSAQPPGLGGAQLFLEADADGDGSFEAMVGDTVPAGVPMRIRATNLPPGGVYRIVTDRGTEEVFPALGEVVTKVPAAPWVYVELGVPDAQRQRQAACDPVVGGRTTYCRNRLLMEAVTSPLYVAG